MPDQALLPQLGQCGERLGDASRLGRSHVPPTREG